MVKLGQTTRGTNHGCKYLWLVKNMQVYRNYDKKACYEVLAFNCNGWFVLYSGTLVDCKKFIGNEEIVESLEEDTKRQEKEVSTVETSEIEESAEKDVMEVKQELNARFGKEQYIDTDSVQPNNAITAKIENINHCPNQNTCCIVSPFVHCDYNYKSDSCLKAHKQVYKHMKARSNPEWHHVNLETVRNIDFDMLDEKRKVYLSFYKKWQEVRKNLRRCSCGYSYDRCRNVFRRSLTIALAKKKISKTLVDYFDRQISMVNVECGVWSSAVEVATGQHESRKYNRPTLRY